MKPKMSLLTLGVSDFARSLSFYRDGLGFPPDGYEEGQNICFFKLEGTWLSIYPKNKLAEDATLPQGNAPEPGSFPGFTIAHNVASKEKVDEVFNAAVSAGAKAVKPPQDVFWGGYSSYFADPDGFLWEVAWNPFTDLT
jgi:catechol 2,3-dioxygenase-like lactoylglutathione lyase family enzyme